VCERAFCQMIICKYLHRFISHNDTTTQRIDYRENKIVVSSCEIFAPVLSSIATASAEKCLYAERNAKRIGAVIFAIGFHAIVADNAVNSDMFVQEK